MKKSLFLQLFFPISILFLLIIAAMVFVTPKLVRDNAQADALHSAKRTVNQLKQLRSYYTNNVIKKVVGRDGIRGDFKHEGDPNAVPLPATMIHDLSKIFSSEGTVIKLYSAFPFPNRASRQLDEFGQSAWEKFQKNPDQVVISNEELDGEPVVRVAIADKMVSQVCVNCHNTRPDTPKADWKLNDVRGVLEVNLSIQEQLASGQTIVYTLLTLTVSGLVIVFIVLLIMYRKLIEARLRALLAALHDIANGDGDLTHRLPEKGEDEISKIAHAFNQFAENTQKMIQDIRHISSNLSNMSEKMTGITQESQEVTRKQGDETELMANSILDLSKTAGNVSHLSQEASDITSKTNNSAQQTSSTVGYAISDIQKLSQMLDQAAMNMNQLNNDTDNVGGVVEVIRSIAEQTNLLALNAAIEAARAGEQGRGFAVVADEVRTLAARTQQSTDEIQEMIVQLQSMSQKAVGIMEKSQEQAQLSSAKADEAGRSLTEIVNAIEKIDQINSSIATAGQEQSHIVELIGDKIQAVSGLAENTDKNAELTSNHSCDLSSMSGQLKELLNRFKV